MFNSFLNASPPCQHRTPFKGKDHSASFTAVYLACIFMSQSKHPKNIFVDLQNLSAWISLRTCISVFLWICKFHLFFFSFISKTWSSDQCDKCLRQEKITKCGSSLQPNAQQNSKLIPVLLSRSLQHPVFIMKTGP